MKTKLLILFFVVFCLSLKAQISPSDQAIQPNITDSLATYGQEGAALEKYLFIDQRDYMIDSLSLSGDTLYLSSNKYVLLSQYIDFADTTATAVTITALIDTLAAFRDTLTTGGGLFVADGNGINSNSQNIAVNTTSLADQSISIATDKSLLTFGDSANAKNDVMLLNTDDDGDMFPGANYYNFRSILTLDNPNLVTISPSRAAILGQGQTGNLSVADHGSIEGLYGLAYHNGTGTVTTLRGADVVAHNNQTGTVTNMIGIRSQVANNHASGTVTNGYNFFAHTPVAPTGAMTNHYLFYFANTNATVTNKYGLYIADGDYDNYLLGSLSVGNTTINQARLNITGADLLSTTPAIRTMDSGFDNIFLVYNDGHLRWNKYGVGTFNNTDDIGLLSYDASGNIQEMTFAEAGDSIGGDGNFAETDLTATGDRSHSFASYNLTHATTASPNTLFVDGGTGFVGIGTGSPGTKLNVADGHLRLSTDYRLEWAGTSAFIEGSDIGRRLRFEAKSGSQWTDQGVVRLWIDNGGDIGINTNAPTEILDINGDAIRIRTSQTPASASATGTAGMIVWDANYIYVCTATDTWVRAALSTW